MIAMILKQAKRAIESEKLKKKSNQNNNNSLKIEENEMYQVLSM